MTTLRYVSFPVAALLLAGGTAAAQEATGARVSAETVVSASMLSGNDRPGVVFDATGRIDLGRGATIVIRPWAWRRPDATWSTQWYQLQLRYQTRTRVPLRFDAGIITSPLGLNTLQMRADINPTIAPVFYYVAALPRFEAAFERLNAITAGYPIGAMVSASGARWDLRGGVTDATPARPRAPGRTDQPPAMPQAILGGGVSPLPGVRVGAGFAHGGYRRATAAAPRGTATVVNLEGEYAFNQTRLSGEWVQDRFRAGTATFTSRSFYAQAVQTITPRLFGAGRIVRTQSPPFFVSGLVAHRTTLEVTAGYRLTTEWTIRGGYIQERPYTGPDWEHQAAVSIVWAKRWY
ncbi:MAG TPA: hypothetical protein VFK57_22785 [Vicinamibacterales bacterium]|nr:hypothetical protein [Vicinamibacterales bacterium]